MHDAEVGHILTNLFSSGRPRQGLSPPKEYSGPVSGVGTSYQAQRQDGEGQILTPASSASTPFPGHAQNQVQYRNDDGSAQIPSDRPGFSDPGRIGTASPVGSRNGAVAANGANANGNGVTPFKRSRSRPTKSCEECRRKKLKCDRELPCSNCKKGGRDGSHCYFKEVPGPVEKRARIEEAPSSMGSRHFEEDLRMQRDVDRYPNMPRYLMEERIRGPGRGIMPFGIGDVGASNSEPLVKAWAFNPPTPMVDWSAREEITGGAERGAPVSEVPPRNEAGKALGRVHVKGTKSRYIGIGDRMAMLDHFDDSKGFILGSFKDPDMSGFIHELAAYQQTFQPRHKPRHPLPYDPDELMAEMVKALPSGYLFGILQARYISNWETICRVLHIDTFMKQCDQVSHLLESGSSSLPTDIPGSIIPQILAIISTAARLDDPSDRSSSMRQLSEDQISKNLQMIKAWLDGLQGKALAEFSTLQTKTLLLIAREANLEKCQELWVHSGELIRHAMALGLHQDPEPFEDMPKFLKEQRRKLWMTIVELDLQFSLASGMPSALRDDAFNMRRMINVDDHDLTEDMTDYPPDKPWSMWTHALPQIALGASLRERLRVINLLGGNIDLERDAPLLLQHAETLERELLSLPTLFRASTRAGNASNKRLYRLFTSITIDIATRRPLMMIYRTISVSPLSSRYPDARKGALRHALAILGHIDSLDPSVADLNIVKTREYLNLFHILRPSDILQSAIVLLHEIKSYNTQSSHSSSDPNEEEFSIPQTSHSLTRVVENMLKSMIERLGEFGSDLKDILPIAVALQAVRSDGTKEEKKALMIKGAERVLDACRKARPEIGEKYREELERTGGAHNEKEWGQGHGHKNNINPFWGMPNGQKKVQTPGGVVAGYDDFSMDNALNFENLDFGFFDWGLDASSM